MMSTLNSSNPVIAIIETKINVPFISQDEKTGNICFSNNNELRTEFRESFDEQHILYYILSITGSNSFDTINLNGTKLHYPKDSVYFWLHVYGAMNASDESGDFSHLYEVLEKLLIPALWEGK